MLEHSVGLPGSKGPPRRSSGVTIAQANARITTLSRLVAETASGPEDLLAAVDADIQVARLSPTAHRLSLMLDGLPVSWCTVIEFAQQVGGRVLRMGGVAGVGTHNDYRFRGFSRRVMENSHRWMRQEGFDTAMLYGITGFYPKFGYAEAFPNVVCTLATRDAERAHPAGFAIADFDAARHLGPVLEMYGVTNAGRTGPTRRDPARWAPFRNGCSYGSRPAVKLFLSGRRAVAYLACDAAAGFTVTEVGYSTPAVFGDLLSAAGRLAWSARLEKVTLMLPEDEPFVAYCAGFGLRKELTCRRDGGAMVRMIDIPSALVRLAPLLAERLERCSARCPRARDGRAGAGGQLTLRTNLDHVRLAWRGGRVTAPAIAKARLSGEGGEVRLPQWALAQLIYGYRGVPELARARAVAGSPQALATLAAMFPPGPHYHYLADKF